MAEAVEVLMLLVMPLVAGHRIVKRPGKQGQTLTLPTRCQPDDIFVLFFDAKVLKLLCANTNKNAKKNLGKGKKFA